MPLFDRPLARDLAKTRDGVDRFADDLEDVFRDGRRGRPGRRRRFVDDPRPGRGRSDKREHGFRRHDSRWMVGEDGEFDAITTRTDDMAPFEGAEGDPMIDAPLDDIDRFEPGRVPLEAELRGRR